jgi:hypothetical protein
VGKRPGDAIRRWDTSALDEKEEGTDDACFTQSKRASQIGRHSRILVWARFPTRD